MQGLSLLRNKTFWLLDSIKGSKVKTAYKTIEDIDKRNSDDEFVLQYQQKAWELLRKHAVSETRFYKDYSESMNLQDFPVVTKNDIKMNQDAFISEKHDKEKLIQMATSGSTGTPFISYQSSLKKKWVNAEVIFYSEKVGYKLGDNLTYIRTVVKKNKKSAVKQFIQNQRLLNCGVLNDDGIVKLLDELKNQSQKGNVTVLGYGSTYKLISDYLNRKRIESLPEIKLVGGISGSDMLFDDVRSNLEKIFGGGGFQLVSRYSNEENGVIGQDDSKDNVFEINEASYIVEILDDNGCPVEDGLLGHIVITDLYNYAMPMIRYDTGDIGAVEFLNNKGRIKRCIGSFSGRKVDVIYSSKGNPLSPHTITNHMWEFTDIKQFQIIQIDKSEYKLRLNVTEEFSREQDLIKEYKSILGDDSIIHTEYVDEIPVLNSGKRRYIVNEYNSK